MTLGFSACGQGQTTRQALGAQDEADSSTKFQELAPAEGDFTGQLTLASSGQKFAAILRLRRQYENVHSDQSTDPTATTAVPKLGGDLRFTALEGLPEEDYPDFSALIDPMGHSTVMTFTFGDYTPSSGAIVLPYMVNGYSQGNYGQLSGKLSASQIQATWTANPFGTVGTLELSR
jgi:hypothetical protein